MTLLIPSRIVRLVFFTLSAGCAGLISPEATAVMLCLLVMLAACCRGPIRLELVLAGMAAIAARYSGGNFEGFKAAFLILLPLVVAMGGWYIMSGALFGPRRERYQSSGRCSRWWR